MRTGREVNSAVEKRREMCMGSEMTRVKKTINEGTNELRDSEMY